MITNKTSRTFYDIRVEGELGDMWVDWFTGLAIHKEFDRQHGCPITVLYGPIPDQPALHAVLNKIRDLNLTLISIKKCDSKEQGDIS